MNSKSTTNHKWPYKKVIVIGGAGCIGIAVCTELRVRGIDVSLFDLAEQIFRVRKVIPQGTNVFYGSILDKSSISEAMKGCDAVIHLAAYLGVKRTELNKLRCIEINVDGTKNVLDCAIQQRLKKIVFSSSSEVYGDPKENPITENTLVHGKTVYAVTKLMGEELCKAYTQKYPELNHVILRYFNAYGPYQASQFVVPKFISSVLKDQPPEINGDGKQRRSYCYVSDTAWATIEALMKDEANGEIINVGNSANIINIKDLADKIIRLTGKYGEINPVFLKDFKNADRDQSREIVDRYCDTRKARSLLNFEPKVTLDEGLKRIIESQSLFEKWESTEAVY